MKSTEQAAQETMTIEQQFIKEQQDIAAKANAQIKELKEAGLWQVYQDNTNYRVRQSILTLAKNIIGLKK